MIDHLLSIWINKIVLHIVSFNYNGDNILMLKFLIFHQIIKETFIIQYCVLDKFFYFLNLTINIFILMQTKLRLKDTIEP